MFDLKTTVTPSTNTVVLCGKGYYSKNREPMIEDVLLSSSLLKFNQKRVKISISEDHEPFLEAVDHNDPTVAGIVLVGILVCLKYNRGHGDESFLQLEEETSDGKVSRFTFQDYYDNEFEDCYFYITAEELKSK